MERLTRLLHGRRMMGALAAGAIGLVLASAALLRLLPLGQHSTIGVPRIVFAVFGQTTDTLYVAPATKPEHRVSPFCDQDGCGWSNSTH